MVNKIKAKVYTLCVCVCVCVCVWVSEWLKDVYGNKEEES